MNAKEPFTHLSTELCATVWTLSDDAKGSRVALQVSADLVLAALLGGHSLSLKYGGAVDERWLIYIPRRVSLHTACTGANNRTTWLPALNHLGRKGINMYISRHHRSNSRSLLRT